MAHTVKRRITTNLLHAAFLLLFLRGNIPYIDHVYRLNGNYSSSSEYILGSSWGYAQTDFHRYNNYNNDIHIHPKALNNSFDYEFLNHHHHHNDILDVIRSPSIQSFRSNISAISKPVPAFQNNVTAYLVSNTSVSISNQLPALPGQVQPPPLLLSVNVDVPSSGSSSGNNINDQDNISGSNSNQISSSLVNPQIQLEEGVQLEEEEESENIHQDQENIFRFISGNIVLLPETEENGGREQPDLLASIQLPPGLEQRGEEEVPQNDSQNASTESRQATNGVEEEPILPWTGSIWEELGNNLDEDFSLGVALDESRFLEGRFLQLDAQYQHARGYLDEEDLAAIPPMALHTHSDAESDGEDAPENSASLLAQSSRSSVSGYFDEVMDDEELEAVALSSLFDDILGESDSGVFENFLASPTDQQSRLEEVQSEPSSPLVNVVPLSDENSNDNSNASGGLVAETNEEDRESVNESEMIQTASIYSNARPTSHPSQPRGLQVHGRMQSLLRESMDQRWQEILPFLNLQHGPQHDPNGGLPPHHHFAPHHHHHHHHLHHPSSSIHHPMHHPPFSSTGPPAPTVSYHSDMSRGVLLHNASLPVPPELNTTSSYSNAMGPPPNVGTLGPALASSMHLTNSSDPGIDPSSNYQRPEHHHDMIYYPNMTSNANEMNNQSTEGLLSSILNDEDLQIMDMAVNEGLYTMRMMDNTSSASVLSTNVGLPTVSHPSACSVGASASIITNSAAIPEDRMEASSDSAVSMGSERVSTMTDPHMSDTEWTDADAHPHGSHDSTYSSDYASKLRGYEYYGKGESLHRVAAPVAQKKHQMFGKRVQQEPMVHPYPSSGQICIPYTPAHQSSSAPMDPLEMKYSCSVDFVRHDQDGRVGISDGSAEIHSNHSYSLPQSHLPTGTSTLSLRAPRQPAREKPKKEYMSRDEKRARSMSLPMNTDDIINLPMDEFNERLSKYDLSESQLSLIRDIRRRGKNKVAAQNCRKRKLDQIHQLAEEVQKIRDRKHSLLRDQESFLSRRNHLKEKYAQLYRIVFQALRDENGNPVSQNTHSLQQAADGNIILVPRNTIPPSTSTSDPSIRRGGRNFNRDLRDDKKDGQA